MAQMVKLAQIQFSSNGKWYLIVSRDYETRHWKISCMPLEGLFAYWNSLASEQKESANFMFENGIDSLRVSNTVLNVEASQAVREFSLEFDDNRGTIWDFLALMHTLHAEVVIDGVAVPVTSIKFSYSTPSITVGAYTANGYVSRTIWSYDIMQAQQFTEFRMSMDSYADFASSSFMQDITDEQYDSENDIVSFNIPVRGYPSAYSEQVTTMLSTCPALMCEHIVRTELAQSMIDGLNSAYRLMRYVNHVESNQPVSSQPYTPKHFTKNLKIIKKIDRPSCAAFNKKVFNKETDYYLNKILNSSPEDLESVLQTSIFKSADPHYVKAFYTTFSLIFSQDGDILDHEYQQYMSQAKELLFMESLQWFKFKIAMLEYDITGVAGIPFQVAGGSIEFSYIISSMWGNYGN